MAEEKNTNTFEIDLTPSWKTVMKVITMLIESNSKASMFKQVGHCQCSPFQYISDELSQVGNILDREKADG